MSTILGYCDKMSATAGEAIRFMVSCEETVTHYEVQIMRLTCTDDHPDGPGRQEVAVNTPVTGRYPGRQQRIAIGSYVALNDATALDTLESFTVQVIIWPTTPDHQRQGLVTRWSESEQQGFALVIDAGCAALMLGRGTGTATLISSGIPLIAREWYRVTASYNATDGTARITQTPLRENPVLERIADATQAIGRHAYQMPNAPLLFAAWQNETNAVGFTPGGHYNGKLEAPRLVATVLDDPGMLRLPVDCTLAAWDFSRDISNEVVTDCSPNQLHGRTCNLPTRAVTGHHWNGEELCWQNRPNHYAAIHFHDDDLADAGWESDFNLVVPDDLASGVYAARLQCDGGLDYVPFAVRPPLGTTTAPIAFLLSSATYTAYANTRMAISDPLDEIERGALYELFDADLYLQEHPELGLSLYDTHFDGSPVVCSSRLRPVLNIRPGTRLWNFNADMMVVDWLTTKGIAFDVITDEDLDRDGLSLLAPYQTVLTGSHPEYFSNSMMGALEGYLGTGGRLMYLGGNGFYWQISFHPSSRGIIECRKSEGVRNYEQLPGERHHAFDGEPGGLWRNRGRGPNQLVGIGTTAFGFDSCGHYRRTQASFEQRAAFIFEGVGEDELIGNFGLVGNGAAGIEIDRVNRKLGSPAHVSIVAHSGGLSRCYLPAPEEMPYLHPAMAGDENPQVRADMVFFEGPEGGAVFSTGSIAWATSLCHNGAENNVSRITENVLNRFVDQTPFVEP